MKSCLRMLAGLLIVLLVVLFVALIAALAILPGRLKTSIEAGLEYAFLCDVTCDSLTVQYGKDTIEIKGLRLTAREDAQQEPAIVFGTVTMTYNRDALLTGTASLKTLAVKDIEMNVRHKLLEGVNLAQFIQNARRSVDVGDPEAPWLARRLYRVKELKMESGKATVTSSLLPGNGLNVVLAPFTVPELDGGQPISLSEASARIVEEILKKGITFEGALKPLADKLRGRPSASPAESPPSKEPAVPSKPGS